MSANAVLDIAIGLILMYLVISLMGTVINEFVATKLKLRAENLKDALQEILDDPTLHRDFYNHGLIDGTNKAIKSDHVSYLSGDTFAMAVVGSLDPTKPIPGFSDVKAAVQSMPDCNIRDALLAQITAANGSLVDLRQSVATYFDTVMDRVSGAYKRKLKWISLWVGLAVVSVLNADSIVVGSALWKDSSLRSQMVQSAGAVLSAGPNAPDDNGKLDQFKEHLQNLESHLRPLPIGWPDRALAERYSAPKVQSVGSYLQSYWDLVSNNGAFFGWWLVLKIIGLSMTAIAVSLGAPFWFDTLSKFMNVRGAGPQPQRASDQS